MISFNLPHTLESGYVYPYFTDEDAETQWVNYWLQVTWLINGLARI